MNLENPIFSIPGTYEIREGKALEQFNPLPIKLSGVFSTPAEFVKKREPFMLKERTHVVFDYPNNLIRLKNLEETHWADEITGKLEAHPLLLALNINNLRGYTFKELYTALRMQGRFFQSRDQHKELLRKLLNKNIRVTNDTVELDDRQGGISATKKISVSSINDEQTLNFGFTLLLPIFPDTDPETIKIDTELDVVNGEVKILLVSEELIDKMESLKEKLFEEQRPNFEDFFIVVQR